ncbi:hypothetical protein Esti_000311 [Eimeria stiedai]
MLSGLVVELPSEAKARRKKEKKKSRSKKQKTEKKPKKHKKHKKGDPSSSSSSDEATILSPQPRSSPVASNSALAAAAAGPAAAAAGAAAGPKPSSNDLELLQQLLQKPFASCSSPQPTAAAAAEPAAAAAAAELQQQGREALQALLRGEKAPAPHQPEPKEEQSIATERELNPYFKEGGSGLPPQENERGPTAAAGGGLSLCPGAQLWRRRQLLRLQQRAASEGIPLEAALQRHFGALTAEALAAFQSDLLGRGRGPRPQRPTRAPRDGLLPGGPPQQLGERFAAFAEDDAEASGDWEALRARLAFRREREAQAAALGGGCRCERLRNRPEPHGDRGPPAWERTWRESWRQGGDGIAEELALSKLERKLVFASEAQRRIQQTQEDNCNLEGAVEAVVANSSSSNSSSSSSSSSKSNSSKDLNALSAQVLRARLRGDAETAKNLEGQLALKRLKGEGLQQAAEERPAIAAAAAAVAAAATLPQRQQQPTGVTQEETHRGPHKKRRAEPDPSKPFTDRMWGDERLSVAQLVRKEKHFSAAANEAEVNRRLLAGSRGVDSMRARILAQKREQKSRRLHQSQATCFKCIDSPGFSRSFGNSLLSLSPFAFLSSPPMSLSVHRDHLLIVPVPHCSAVTGLEPEAFECIRNYSKSLVAFFSSRGEAPLFIETVRMQPQQERQMAGLGPHTEIEVLPIPADRLKEARSYFRKALDESERIWASHKTVIETKDREGVRTVIPKGFPYIHVDFSLEDGLAHVIEEGEEFKTSFGREVVLGMLGLEQTERPFRDHKLYMANVQRLKREFAAFDWVQLQDEPPA